MGVKAPSRILPTETGRSEPGIGLDWQKSVR